MTTNNQTTTTHCYCNAFCNAFRIWCIFEEDAPFGYVYSSGNYSNGNDMLKPEFLARNVPRHKAESAGAIMDSLSSRTINDGERAYNSVLDVTIRLIEGEEKEQLLENYCFVNKNTQAPLYELIPLYPHEDPNDWGSKPCAPEGREEFAQEIWKTLTDPEIHPKFPGFSFFRFIDGNIQNPHFDNLTLVPFEEALRHVDDWAVDWDLELTSNQISYVRAYTDYFIRLASTYVKYGPSVFRWPLHVEEETKENMYGLEQ